jgi:XTP/dITP diphosphohydrolase
MADHFKDLLVATNNPGKLAELRELLDSLPVDLRSLANFEPIVEVEETGATFVENARLKASGYAIQTGLPALADDSGLEVEALGGRPGVLSARYGGLDTGFDVKMAKLLGELDDISGASRAARFVCAIAIADPIGNILHTTEGICSGSMAFGPRGRHGFGYDPLFIPDGYDLTFGELSGATKGEISHRKRAFDQIMPFLRDFIAV